MWKYNYNTGPNELYHYGVPGMKWGERKAEDPAMDRKAKYKQAKAEFRAAKKEFRKTRGLGLGYDGTKRYNAAYDKFTDAETKFISAKGDYKAGKSAAAEERYYTNRMYKTGFSGSEADTMNRGRSTKIYNELVRKKGEEYARTIDKRVYNKTIATAFTVAAIEEGSAWAWKKFNAYLEKEEKKKNENVK